MYVFCLALLLLFKAGCWLVPCHSTPAIKRSWAFSLKLPRIEPNYQYLIKPPRGFQPAVVHECCHLNQLFSTFNGCVNNMWSLDHEDPDPAMELCVLNHLPALLCLSTYPPHFEKQGLGAQHLLVILSLEEHKRSAKNSRKDVWVALLSSLKNYSYSLITLYLCSIYFDHI